MIEKSGSPGFGNLSGVALCQVLGEGIRVPRCSGKTEERKEPLTVCKMSTCISDLRNGNEIEGKIDTDFLIVLSLIMMQPLHLLHQELCRYC